MTRTCIAILTLTALTAPAFCQRGPARGPAYEDTNNVPASPEIHPDRTVTFRLFAPKASEVLLMGSPGILEFLKEPQFDFVFTVCDDAAAESCPVWPGQPATAHWGIADPAEVTGTPAEIAMAFKEAYRLLNQRIGIFTSLPLRSLDHLTLESKLRDIGRMEGATRVPERH